MNAFPFKCNDFKNFIRNSKLKLEDDLEELNFEILRLDVTDKKRYQLKKILRKLDTLTRENKIIWSIDIDKICRGVVIDNCTFSDYKILIEKSETYNLTGSVRYEADLKYKISFIKGVLAIEGVEYLIDSADDDVISLINTIEKKLLQERN